MEAQLTCLNLRKADGAFDGFKNDCFEGRK
jgi:hypothetical protein